MLKVAYSAGDLSFEQLCRVYEQSCREDGQLKCPGYSSNEQILAAEQELYEQVRCFFREKNVFYGIWVVNDCYVSALRIEPYRDGFLLTGLETAPEARRKGYASTLIANVLSEIAKRGSARVYSHVERRNTASIAVHKSCGFEKCLDYAVYLDGSVSTDAYTLAITV